MATESKGGDRQRKHPHFFKVFLPGLTSEKLVNQLADPSLLLVLRKIFYIYTWAG